MSPNPSARLHDSPRSNPLSSFISTSAIGDLSYTPSAEENRRDAIQTLVTGRKSWKTLKGKGEAVWPPYLEAALIEALEKYRPQSLKAKKPSGRFPMRNRFISDHIYLTTGKRRTPKQVGSRLQQLRDTCSGRRILDLLSGECLVSEGGTDATSISSARPSGARRTRMNARTIASSPTPSAEHSSVSSESSFQSPVSLVSELEPATYISDDASPSVTSIGIDRRREGSMVRRCPSVIIPILPPSISRDLSPIPLDYSTSSIITPFNTTISFPETPFANGELNITRLLSSSPSHLRSINPTVVFKSLTSASASDNFCLFDVFLDGVRVHSESAKFQSISTEPGDSDDDTFNGPYSYSVNLVPKYWDQLCEFPDPSHVVIVHKIMRTSPTAHPLWKPCSYQLGEEDAEHTGANGIEVVKITYQFQYLNDTLYIPVSPVATNAEDMQLVSPCAFTGEAPSLLFGDPMHPSPSSDLSVPLMVHEIYDNSYDGVLAQDTTDHFPHSIFPLLYSASVVPPSLDFNGILDLGQGMMDHFDDCPLGSVEWHGACESQHPALLDASTLAICSSSSSSQSFAAPA